MKKIFLIFLTFLFTANMFGCEQTQIPKEPNKYNLYEKTDILWLFTEDKYKQNHIIFHEIEKINDNTFEIYFTPKIELKIKHIRTYPINAYGNGVLGCKHFYDTTYTNINEQNRTLPNIFYSANVKSKIEIFYTNEELQEFTYFNEIEVDQFWCESYYYVPN